MLNWIFFSQHLLSSDLILFRHLLLECSFVYCSVCQHQNFVFLKEKPFDALFLQCLQLGLVHSSHSMNIHWINGWMQDHLGKWLFGCTCYCFCRLGAYKWSSEPKGAGIWNFTTVKLTSSLTDFYFHEWYMGELTSHSCQHSSLTNNFLSNLWVKKKSIYCYSNLHFFGYCCSWPCFCFLAMWKSLFVNYLFLFCVPFST